MLGMLTTRTSTPSFASSAFAPVSYTHLAHTYDVILMDLQMPVLGGLDAARRIRRSSHPQAAAIPIIALTANAVEEDRRETLEAGMNGFVPKPIDFTILAKEIARVRREGRCRRLLLAEDNELNREIAVELIRADGQQVDAVENGCLLYTSNVYKRQLSCPYTGAESPADTQCVFLRLLVPPVCRGRL